MSLQYTITATVTTANEDGCLRLFHGTLATHFGSLTQHGIDFTKSDGCFWATPEVWNARQFAELAEQQMMFANLPPGQMILGFDIPIAVLDSFQVQQPNPWLAVYAQGYRFSQACSTALHGEMKNIEITFE